jgi:ureidoglycolate hydrolase
MHNIIFRGNGQDGIYRGVDLVGNAYRAFFRMNRHSIHLLERHGLESDIFVLMENQGT